VQGTQTLLDAAVTAGVERSSRVSTDEVYGEAVTGEFSEADRAPGPPGADSSRFGTARQSRAFSLSEDVRRSEPGVREREPAQPLLVPLRSVDV
jgi:nucleoside-diphosphate-sugar epimerase